MPPREALSHAAAAFNEHAPSREVSLERARALIVEHAKALRRQDPSLRLSQSAGNTGIPILAEAVRADRPWPPFRRSMRDGYALRFRDRALPLSCCGEIRAGMAAPPACPPGACIAIMTGAPVPGELDMVVMVEQTRQDEAGRIVVTTDVQPGDNIAEPGSDSAAGAVVAAAGQRLTPAALAAAAAAGVIDPVIAAPPRVAILASGDELVPAAARPGPAQIRNSNGPMLAAQCRRYGAEIITERLLPDDVEAMEAALRQALDAGAEIILFSGGASVGSADLVAPLLERQGVGLAFDAVRVRPGRPVLFGARAARLYFGLPGNPVGAAMACALQVRLAIEVLAGIAPEALTAATVAARLGFDYAGKALPLDAFRPVRLAPRGLSAEVLPLGYQGSADLAAAAAAAAFLHVPPGVTAMHTGDWVGVVLP